MVVYVLPNRLRLVSIPRLLGRILTSHVITRCILYPKSKQSFFSYTENAVEISIIADADIIDSSDFPVYKHPDKEFEWSAKSNENSFRTVDEYSDVTVVCPGLKKSHDIFRALEIDEDPMDAHKLSPNSASNRISAFAEPLAHAGISIFYLSTYQADLLLVRERDLTTVQSLLSAKGFEFSEYHAEVSDTDTDEFSEDEAGEYGAEEVSEMRRSLSHGDRYSHHSGSNRNSSDIVPVSVEDLRSKGVTSIVPGRFTFATCCSSFDDR